MKEEAVFTINHEKYTVDDSVPVGTSLNTYIRNYANLKGTKSMCHEGGCGACVVSATFKHPATGEMKTCAVNSCLLPVQSCNGWNITTIEGLGNRMNGYNTTQIRLAQFNGTQCGYCSPGMVMNMHSLLEDKTPTMKEVENSFGGNICRCTGYRSILDAFKSLASDAPPELKNKCGDIEDLDGSFCKKRGEPCAAKCTGLKLLDPLTSSSFHLQAQDGEWFTVTKIEEILNIFEKIGDSSYILVAGNTAKGVYHWKEQPQYFININEVTELKTITESPELVLGGNVSLTEAMSTFYKLSQEHPDKYGYTSILADHIDLIANVPVRNMGTIAGNLSIKHQYKEFPSDLFLIFETVGATLDIVDKTNAVTTVSLCDYLKMDMKHKVIKSVSLPALDGSYHLGTYKIMPRAQNAHAYVNAGFRFKLNNSGEILEKPVVTFGGINPDFIHATKTEALLQGKNLFQQNTLDDILKTLNEELKPDYVLPDASPEYRKGLAKGLLYKFILKLAPDSINRSMKSGGDMLVRPVSSGKQNYDADKSVWPLNQPIPKIEAFPQCSGEARYVNDTPNIPGELHAAFVISTVARGTIEKINPTDALSVKGVVTFIGADAIPGTNSFTTPSLAGLSEPEEILCDTDIKYAGQPIGIIVAETLPIALKASKMVKVFYKDVKNPILTIEDAIKSGDSSRIVEKGKLTPTDTKAKSETKHVIKGSFNIGSQYHYTMETQTCLCIPIEDGMDVYPSTQWMDLTQIAISQALGVPENSININVRRLGGAYGVKISRASHVAAACAVAAKVVAKPVRFVLSMQDNMKIFGKRYPCACEYEVGVDDNGVIKYMDTTLYENSGCTFNESVIAYTVHHFVNCYKSDTWSVVGKAVKTDIPSNTYCRAPGSTEGIAFIETIMEHIAKFLNIDSIQVRLNNLKDQSIMAQQIKDIKASSSYDDRALTIEEFNKENRWKKRGMAISVMEYPFAFWGNFPAMVSIYAGDGTVAVAHGGIECGQGINTKVLQVCAYTLGIALEQVSIKPSNNLTAPNGTVTGGSVTSEACAYATMMCCKELLKRLEPVKEKLKDASWKEIVGEAYKENIDLCATYMFTARDAVKPYSIWGATVAEVEVDMLTGQQQILRVDLLEDAGISMSPEIDIGQMEGAFVMGLGYWLMEYLVYDEKSGELITNRTWNYKTPGAKDIPIDFRIQFRRNAPNPTGVLRSKATGEPPLCMSVVVTFALRNALDSARQDAGDHSKWYNVDSPFTTEKIFLSALTKDEQFKL